MLREEIDLREEYFALDSVSEQAMRTRSRFAVSPEGNSGCGTVAEQREARGAVRKAASSN